MNESKESGYSNNSRVSNTGKLGVMQDRSKRAASSMNMKGNSGKMSALGINNRRANVSTAYQRSSTALGKSSRVVSRVGSRKNSVTVNHIYIVFE